MRLPSTNPVTLPYGATSPPYTAASPHAGTDYAGSDLNSYAPEDVKITDFFPYDGVNPCGNQLDMMSLDGQRTYRFCHSSSVYCQVGQVYKEGTVLAKEGAVGYAFGVHLHFVMWVNGIRVDGDATLKKLIGGSEMFTQDDYNAIKPMFTTFGQAAPPAGICVGFPVAAALGALLGSPEWEIVKSQTLMGDDSLTRLHKLAMGSAPGPAYIGAFKGQVLDPAMKQLEGDPNRLNIKPGNTPATLLAPGTYQVK